LVYAELKSAIDTSKEEGFQEGRIEERHRIAKGLKDKAIDSQIISETTGLSIEDIDKL